MALTFEESYNVYHIERKEAHRRYIIRKESVNVVKADDDPYSQTYFFRWKPDAVQNKRIILSV